MMKRMKSAGRWNKAGMRADDLNAAADQQTHEEQIEIVFQAQPPGKARGRKYNRHDDYCNLLHFMKR
jgi:hypothetical protein